jgi:hypothetical protein
MSTRDRDEVNKLPSRDPYATRTNTPISSLNDAWFHTLDSCAVNFPLSDVILPLTRDCFVAGAIYAVLLLQRGHGDQLARDIAGFIDEASSSSPPEPSNSRRERLC